MVLLEDSLLPVFIKSLRIADLYAAIPFKWNPVKFRLELKSSLPLHVYNIRRVFASAYLLFAAIQVAWIWDVADTQVKSHSILTGTVYMISTVGHYLYATEGKAILQHFNWMVRFEKRRQQESKQKSPEDRGHNKIELGAMMIIYFMPLLAASGVGLPPLFFLDAMRNPCYPVYIGYWLSEQCQAEIGVALPSTWSLWESGTKVFIALALWINWGFVFACHCFQDAFDIMLKGHCFRSYISSYGREMMNLNAKKFNETAMKKALTFREIQLMAIGHRAIYCKYFFGAYTTANLVASIMCLRMKPQKLEWISVLILSLRARRLFFALPIQYKKEQQIFVPINSRLYTIFHVIIAFLGLLDWLLPFITSRHMFSKNSQDGPSLFLKLFTRAILWWVYIFFWLRVEPILKVFNMSILISDPKRFPVSQKRFQGALANRLSIGLAFTSIYIFIQPSTFPVIMFFVTRNSSRWSHLKLIFGSYYDTQPVMFLLGFHQLVHMFHVSAAAWTALIALFGTAFIVLKFHIKTLRKTTFQNTCSGREEARIQYRILQLLFLCVNEGCYLLVSTLYFLAFNLLLMNALYGVMFSKSAGSMPPLGLFLGLLQTFSGICLLAFVLHHVMMLAANLTNNSDAILNRFQRKSFRQLHEQKFWASCTRVQIEALPFFTHHKNVAFLLFLHFTLQQLVTVLCV
ncbi:unnamed protein product [Orchesella dallaii]|uniref:Uncharacterized protein n=1 Tax=Orchesella dallaii TaxID=48710 RepID=A0ABP1QB33_9HEXA